MTKIKHLFFDLDNTILDFSYASKHAFKATLAHFDKAHEEAYKIYNVGNTKVWEEFENGKITAIELRGKRFQVFLDAMDWDGDGFEWNRIYLEHVVQNNKYIEGAQKLILQLGKTYKIDIVTNGLREVQRPRLLQTSLMPHLNSITVSDEIGYAKPHASFFQVAMKNANASHIDEVLMIGDSYRSDIKGGAAFGMKTCWFNPSEKKVDSKVHDFEIHHINMLEEVLSNAI